MAEQSCRTCEHWGKGKQLAGRPVNLCYAHAPNSVPALPVDRFLMQSNEGTDCPAWQAIGGGDE